MKKVITIMLVMVFAAGIISAYAATSADHRPASKSITQGTFQGAADHVENWGKSKEIVKGQSLRGNQAEIKKRRGCKK